MPKVLDAAYEAGCTFWDTSDLYGDSEDLIGQWCVVDMSYGSFDIHSVMQVQAHGQAQ